MKKLKILYLITDLGKGGAERFLLDLINYLDHKEDIEYKIGVLYDAIGYDEFRNNSKIIQMNYQTFSFKKQNRNANYSKLLDDFQPDIIHSNRYLAEFITAYDVRPNIQYVCHCHDNMIQLKKLSLKSLGSKQNILNSLEARFLKVKKYNKVPTYFIANSKHTEDYFTSNLPTNQKKNVHLIQYGFNFDNFYKKIDSEAINRKLQILNIGSYQIKKNHVFLIEIANHLKMRNIDFEMNLLGDGPEFEKIAKMILEYNLEGSVFQRGNQSNVNEWCAKSHIYLHTATYEPFGLVFLEAMASGLPIVTLDGLGNRDLIENGVNGYLLKDQNADEFVDRIVELFEDSDNFDKIRMQAQKFSKNFDVSKKMEDLISFYHSII